MHNKVPKNEYTGGKKPSSFRGNPYKKDRVVYDKKSELGYSDGSPYAALPYIDIYTPQGIIDMSNTGIPLTANGQYLPPYSGLYNFGTNVVREIPIPIFETKEDFYKDALRRKRDVYWDNDSSGSGVPFPITNMPSRSTGVSMPSVNTGYQGIAMQYGGDPSIPELDQAKKGGWLNKYSKMPKKKSSKNIKTSINKLMTRNPLFERNYTLYGAKGPRLYDPNSKYQDGGVTINSEEEYRKSLLMKNKTKERIDAERAWAAKKVASANQAKTQQPSGIPLPQGNQPYTYNWSAADIQSKPGPVATPQVVMTSASVPQHDYVREAKVNKAMAEAKEKKDAADLQVQKDQYGNILGTLRYYGNKIEEWGEGDEGSKYYYKDPDTGEMRSFSEVGAYEQVGIPLQDAAYGSFPLFEGAAFITSPIKKGLSKAIAPSVEYLTTQTPLKRFKSTPKQLPGSPNAVQSLEEQMMSLNAPKGNMYGQNQVLTQQSRLLNPSTKAKYFKYQAPSVEPEITSDIFGNKFWKAPKDYGNRITPENYEGFVNNIHGSTEYGIAESTGFQPGNLGVGNYGKPGMVFSDAPLNNLGKDIINAHEKNHGMFVGTMSKEQTNNLLKPFGTKKPIPGYGAKQQADEVLARMGQFKNAVGIGDDQVFTLGHLNLIRKDYANSFLDNGITEMLAKIKPGSIGEKLFLINMNKYAFGIAPIAIGAAAIPAAISSRKAFKKGGSPRKSSKKLVNYSQNHNFVKTQSNSWLDKYK